MNRTETLKGISPTELVNHLSLPNLSIVKGNRLDDINSANNTTGQQLNPDADVEATFQGRFVSDQDQDSMSFSLIARNAAGQTIGEGQRFYLHALYTNVQAQGDNVQQVQGGEPLALGTNMRDTVIEVVNYLKGQLLQGGSDLTIDAVETATLVGGNEQRTRYSIPLASWERSLMQADTDQTQVPTIFMPSSQLAETLRRTG